MLACADLSPMQPEPSPPKGHKRASMAAPTTSTTTITCRRTKTHNLAATCIIPTVEIDP